MCLNPNLNSFSLSTRTPTHTFLQIQLRRILSNLSSLISPLTHVYQRCAPDGYLGNQTGSVGGQGFQVLLLCSLRFPLVALQEQTQQQEWGLITRLMPAAASDAAATADWCTTFGVSWRDVPSPAMTDTSDAFTATGQKEGEGGRSQNEHRLVGGGVLVFSRLVFQHHLTLRLRLVSQSELIAQQIIQTKVRKKKKGRIPSSISKVEIWRLLNEAPQMRSDREFRLMLLHVTHGRLPAAAACLMSEKQGAKSPASSWGGGGGSYLHSILIWRWTCVCTCVCVNALGNYGSPPIRACLWVARTGPLISERWTKMTIKHSCVAKRREADSC